MSASVPQSGRGTRSGAPAGAHGGNPIDLVKVVTWRVPRVNADLLEAVTVPEAAEADFLRDVKAAAGATELLYFPTCQRVLAAVVTALPVEEVARRVHDAFAERAGRELPEPEALGGFDAFAHLAEVAASLDSLVPGEPQVLGQMKDAYRRAEQLQLVGGATRGLSHVFPLVFRTAKAVRTDTDLFRGKVSLIPLTLGLVAEHLADVVEPTVHVVGTGSMGSKMAELVAETVPAARVERVSRSAERGIALDEFLARPPRTHIVALATSADSAFFTRAHAEAFLKASDGEPLLVIDIMLPRGATPDVADVRGVRLVALDSLSEMSARAKADRSEELTRAHDVLDRELERVKREYAELPAQRELAQYRRDVLKVAEARYEQGAEKFEGVFADPEFRKWFEQTIRHVAHVGHERLRRAAGDRKE